MRTVLVTGSNGFAGQYISRLLAHNYRVVATGRGQSRIPVINDQFIYEPLELTDMATVNAAFDRYKPDFVIHSAAMSKPDDCENNREQAYKNNVSVTGHLLEQSARFKSFFLFLSTDFVFDGVGGMYQEDDEPGNPVNYYGLTKLMAEELVKSYAFKWCIVRTILVYGHPLGGRDNILTMVAKGLKQGRTLNIFNDQIRTPTYVEDLAKAIGEIINRRITGVMHISGEDRLTPYQMALAVAEHLDLDTGLIVPVTAESFPQPVARPLQTGFNISKAKLLLDYEPTPFKEGLNLTFKEHR